MEPEEAYVKKKHAPEPTVDTYIKAAAVGKLTVKELLAFALTQGCELRIQLVPKSKS